MSLEITEPVYLYEFLINVAGTPQCEKFDDLRDFI